VADQTESDCLFVIQDVAICVEVKGRTIADAAHQGDHARLRTEIDDTFGSGASQARRLETLIRTNGGIWLETGRWLGLSHIKETPDVDPIRAVSTADLLMESRLAAGPEGNQNLTINLNHMALRVETDGAVGRVLARDLVAEKERILSGALRCAQRRNNRIGKTRAGLRPRHGRPRRDWIDRPPSLLRAFRHPGTSPHARDSDSSKTISIHEAAAHNAHPYTMVVELGAEFNQGRYLDEEIIAEHQRRKGKHTFCEIVFLFHAPLMDNHVCLAGDPAQKVFVAMRCSPAADGYLPEVRDVATPRHRWTESHCPARLLNSRSRTSAAWRTRLARCESAKSSTPTSSCTATTIPTSATTPCSRYRPQPTPRSHLSRWPTVWPGTWVSGSSAKRAPMQAPRRGPRPSPHAHLGLAAGLLGSETARRSAASRSTTWRSAGRCRPSLPCADE